ncbi:MAG: hypothetical protein LR001_03215 [Clostridiales bacterium]|nr:hypothetical protein [Clostridiales bacterium]
MIGTLLIGLAYEEDYNLFNTRSCVTVDVISRFMSKNNKIKCLPTKLRKRMEIVKYAC